MNNFLFSYNGNKYLEIKKYFVSSNCFKDINDYDIIVEPFCGIFGFSRYYYEKGFSGEIWLNDINSDLINYYNKMKNDLDSVRVTKTCWRHNQTGMSNDIWGAFNIRV